MTRTTMIRQRITTSSSASSIGTPPISTITLNGLENPSFQLIIHKLNGKKWPKTGAINQAYDQWQGKARPLNRRDNKTRNNDPTLKT